MTPVKLVCGLVSDPRYKLSRPPLADVDQNYLAVLISRQGRPVNYVQRHVRLLRIRGPIVGSLGIANGAELGRVATRLQRTL